MSLIYKNKNGVSTTILEEKGKMKYEGIELTKVIYKNKNNESKTVWEAKEDLWVFNDGSGQTINGYLAFPNNGAVHGSSTGIHRSPANPVKITRGNEIIVIYNTQSRGSILTKNTVDLTDYNYITINGSVKDYYSTYGAWCTPSQTGSTYEGSDGDYENIVTNGKCFSLNTRIDISSLSGNYYLGMYMCCGNNNLGDAGYSDTALGGTGYSDYGIIGTLESIYLEK